MIVFLAPILFSDEDENTGLHHLASDKVVDLCGLNQMSGESIATNMRHMFKCRTKIQAAIQVATRTTCGRIFARLFSHQEPMHHPCLVPQCFVLLSVMCSANTEIDTVFTEELADEAKGGSAAACAQDEAAGKPKGDKGKSNFLATLKAVSYTHLTLPTNREV